MQESLLHFVWKNQYLTSRTLLTIDGLPLQVLHPGYYDGHAGPDFKEASIEVDGMVWHGSVEIHVKASQWAAHGHEDDPKYQSIILHVVWDQDAEIPSNSSNKVPTLCLQSYVSPNLISQYVELVHTIRVLPCAPYLPGIEGFVQSQALSHALLARLERKSRGLLLDKDFPDWEDVAFKILIKAFGLKVNSAAFEALSHTLSFKVIQKYKGRHDQIESLVFGCAGLLEGTFADEYPRSLQTEFGYLAAKEKIAAIDPSLWNMLRLRPANFPHIRLSQLATVLARHHHFFSSVLHLSTQEVSSLFDVEAHEYWQHHYYFDTQTAPHSCHVGKMTSNILSINVLSQVLGAYGIYTQEQEYIQSACQALESLPAEHNKYTQILREHGFRIENAADSQGGIELFTQFCANRQCASCAVGQDIMASHR